jgi:hypothetical protein
MSGISNCFSGLMRRRGCRATGGLFAKCGVFSESAPGRMDPSLGPDTIRQVPSFSLGTSSEQSKPSRWKPFPTTGAFAATWFRSGGKHSMCLKRTLVPSISGSGLRLLWTRQATDERWFGRRTPRRSSVAQNRCTSVRTHWCVRPHLALCVTGWHELAGTSIPTCGFGRARRTNS